MCALIFQLLFAAIAQSAGESPAPSFLPAPPPISKELKNYTAADVFSVICRSDDSLPVGHLFRQNTLWAEDYISKNWSGAKVTENMDFVFRIFCESDKINAGFVARNVEWFMTYAMDVSDELKAQAIIRVRNSQTDATKKRLMEDFGKRMFLRFFDPQLLFWTQAELDDVTLLPAGPRRVEGVDNPPMTKRQAALKERLDYLKIIGQITDKSPFNGPDEAANCQNMKNLIENHWNEILQNCTQKRANPTTRWEVTRHAWDAPNAP